MDKSEVLIAAGQKHGYAENVQLVVGDATEIPFENGSFDLVVSQGLTSYMSEADLRAYVSEVSRVLAPRGEYFEVYLEKRPEMPLHSTESHFLSNAKGVLACLIDRMTTHEIFQDTERPHPITTIKEEFRKRGFADVEVGDLGRGINIVNFGRGDALKRLVRMGAS